MQEFQSFSNPQVSAEYIGHPIFQELDTCISAFKTLSDLATRFLSATQPFVGSLDSYFFDSLEGTIESIKTVLLAGRFADAYALLRRFNETGLVQLNVAVKLEARRNSLTASLSNDVQIDSEEFLWALKEALEEGMSVKEIDKWVVGENPLTTDAPSKSGSATILDVHPLFDRKTFTQILNRCNDHVHINFLRTLRSNAKMNEQGKLAALEQFSKDFRFLFARYAAYTFTIHPVYMASSDYIDAFDCGQTPIEGSQQWVAPIVQEVLDVVVTPYHAHVTEFLRTTTGMELT